MVKVKHWHFNDGLRIIPEIVRRVGEPTTEYDEELKGWHCWVYVDDAGHKEIKKWLRGCKGEYELDWRFNSGDPMYTLILRDDSDAAAFKLRWICEN